MKLSDRGYTSLRQLVDSHARMDAAQMDELAAMLTERDYARGETLLQAGEQARTAGIVVDGIFGEFYEDAGGMRKAKWLATPGEVVGSMEDLVRIGPARATIQALTDGRLLCLPYAGLRQRALTEPAWAGLFIPLLESLYRRKSEREYSLLMLKADERYRWFQGRYGALEQQLSQEVIASYLGITPVHLSRIRKPQRPRD